VQVTEPTLVFLIRTPDRSACSTQQLGLSPEVARCHLGLGELYRRTGKRELVREHLTTAMAMYREMGMTYWLEQTAETARLG
jgi:hypothetical protein